MMNASLMPSITFSVDSILLDIEYQDTEGYASDFEVCLDNTLLMTWAELLDLPDTKSFNDLRRACREAANREGERRARLELEERLEHRRWSLAR